MKLEKWLLLKYIKIFSLAPVKILSSYSEIQKMWNVKPCNSGCKVPKCTRESLRKIDTYRPLLVSIRRNSGRAGDSHTDVHRLKSHRHRPSWEVDTGLVLFSKRCKMNVYKINKNRPLQVKERHARVFIYYFSDIMPEFAKFREQVNYYIFRIWNEWQTFKFWYGVWFNKIVSTQQFIPLHSRESLLHHKGILAGVIK